MSTDCYNFSGKIVLVTGAGRGIGYAIASGFAQSGATVFVNDLTSASAEAAKERMDAPRPKGLVHALAFDVTNESAVAAAVSQIEETSGGIDVCISNAGVQHRETVDTLEISTYSRILDANLVSHFSLAKRVGGGMTARGHGRLVFIASVLGLHGRAGLAAYCSAKAGLINLTRALCAEFGGSGVTVNGIGPGFIETELTADLRKDQAMVDKVKSRTPLDRWGTPEDLVGPALFLASDSSSFITGQTLFVDGGLTSVFQ